MLFICVTVVMVLVFEETYFNCSTRDPYDVEQLLLMSLGGSYTTRSSQLDPENLHELLVVETIKHDLFFQFLEYEGIRALFSYVCEGVKLISRNILRVLV